MLVCQKAAEKCMNILFIPLDGTEVFHPEKVRRIGRGSIYYTGTDYNCEKCQKATYILIRNSMNMFYEETTKGETQRGKIKLLNSFS